MKRLTILAFLLAFCIPVCAQYTVTKKSGHLLHTDTRAELRGEFICFMINGQNRCVHATEVDLDATKVRGLTAFRKREIQEKQREEEEEKSAEPVAVDDGELRRRREVSHRAAKPAGTSAPAVEEWQDLESEERVESADDLLEAIKGEEEPEPGYLPVDLPVGMRVAFALQLFGATLLTGLIGAIFLAVFLRIASRVVIGEKPGFGRAYAASYIGYVITSLLSCLVLIIMEVGIQYPAALLIGPYVIWLCVNPFVNAGMVKWERTGAGIGFLRGLLIVLLEVVLLIALSIIVGIFLAIFMGMFFKM